MHNILEILFNLGMLTSLSCLSGVIGHDPHKPLQNRLVQGLIFGFASILGMLNPLVLAPGLIFDGRSVMISVAGMYFGPLTAAVAALGPFMLRIYQGGSGMIMGISVITAAAVIGSLFHMRLKRLTGHQDSDYHMMSVSLKEIGVMGLIVHVVMVLLMFTLPKERAFETIKNVGPIVIVAYPLTMMLIGSILSAFAEKKRMSEALMEREKELTNSHGELEAGIEELIAQEEEIRQQYQHIQESEQKLRAVFDEASVGINIAEYGTGIILQANPAFYRLIGKTQSEIIGYSWTTFTHPDDVAVNLELNRGLMEGKINQFELEKRYIKGDGSIIWVTIKNTVTSWDDSGKLYELCFIEDITDKKRALEALQESELSFRSIFESTSDTVLMFNRERIIDCNNSAVKLFGATSKDDIVGKTVDQFSALIQPDGHSSAEKAGVLLKQCRDEGTARFEWLHKRMDGSLFTVEVVLTRISLHGEDIVHASVRDITDRKFMEQRLSHLSYHDQLTGLYNRRYFEEEFKRLNVERNLPLTLMMADVDGLKLVNDSFGHVVGDQLLIKVSELLLKGCRSDDLVARIGGDEFVILLPQTSAREAEEIAGRIMTFSESETIENIQVSMSIGWATEKEMPAPYSDMLKIAEDYLYRKKLFVSPSQRNKTIHTIIHTLHEKNKREELHSYRVAALCESIGTRMGLKAEKIKELKHLGLLHDIGKVGIDEQMLNKPGKLTEIEWREMTKHPEIGYRILSTVNEMKEMAESVLAHHERYDGKGYPRGLKGDTIPLHARIITLADAFDAMISVRPYRDALTREEAIEEVKRNAGTQFDPLVVKAFLLLMEDPAYQIPNIADYQEMNQALEDVLRL